MRSTLTRRTARVVALLGAVPVALVLSVGGNASAEKPAVFGTVSGANTIGAYTAPSAAEGALPQLAGNGGGASGKIAGSVGNADNKNPRGQFKNGDAVVPGKSGNNNGYECDGNNGIGQGNPAHTSTCLSSFLPY